MSRFTRREFLQAGAVGAAGAIGVAGAAALPGCSAEPADDAIAERLADLAPEVGELPPFPATACDERFERLRGALDRAEVDALLLGPTLNLAYFTGARWGASERLFGCVVFRAGAPVWITPAFEEGRARETMPAGAAGDVRAWHEDEDPHRLVVDVLRERSGIAARLAVDSHLRATHAARLAALLPPGGLVDGLPITAAVRATKTPPELHRIRRACELTQRAIEIVRERFIRAAGPAGSAGELTERTVTDALNEAQRRLGLANPWCLALFGPNAAFPHGTKERRPLERGQMVLIDTGGMLDGYQSDVSRTFVSGAPSGRQRDVYRLVRQAQQAALDAMAPDVPCSAIDRAARDVIERGGFGPGFRFFTHRLGHGIGLEGHEDPYFCGADATPLRPGMTLSNEPGIYIPGELGVRIEDIVVMGDARGASLGAEAPRELEEA